LLLDASIKQHVQNYPRGHGVCQGEEKIEACSMPSFARQMVHAIQPRLCTDTTINGSFAINASTPLFNIRMTDPYT
jgi:hypothetical protein